MIIITSPSSAHPSTLLIDSVLASLHYITGLVHDQLPIHIILDGYILREEAVDNRTHITYANSVRYKRGIINREIETKYNAYYRSLCDKYKDKCSIHKLSSHYGFAKAVEYGLRLCSTTFALLLQHDRMFCRPFHSLASILNTMRKNTHIRYVGFPSSCSSNHRRVIECSYGLHSLNISHTLEVEEAPELQLQPLIFWYDSQHIAHVSRYLEIFLPYLHLPPSLRALLTKPFINKMRLRKGDFIEDRFGQCQRNAISQYYIKDGKVSAEGVALFEWFGSYLIWDHMDSFLLQDGGGGIDYTKRTKEYVLHLRGRSHDESRVADTVRRNLEMLEDLHPGITDDILL